MRIGGVRLIGRYSRVALWHSVALAFAAASDGGSLGSLEGGVAGRDGLRRLRARDPSTQARRPHFGAPRGPGRFRPLACAGRRPFDPPRSRRIASDWRRESSPVEVDVHPSDPAGRVLRSGPPNGGPRSFGSTLEPCPPEIPMEMPGAAIRRWREPAAPEMGVPACPGPFLGRRCVLPARAPASANGGDGPTSEIRRRSGCAATVGRRRGGRPEACPPSVAAARRGEPTVRCRGCARAPSPRARRRSPASPRTSA